MGQSVQIQRLSTRTETDAAGRSCTVEFWGERISVGTIMGFMPPQLIEALQDVDRTLQALVPGFEESVKAGRRFRDAINADVHMFEIRNVVENGIYNNQSYASMQSCANFIDTQFNNLSQAITRTRSILLTHMRGKTITAYARELHSANQFLQVVRQTVESNFSNGGDVASIDTQKTAAGVEVRTIEIDFWKGMRGLGNNNEESFWNGGVRNVSTEARNSFLGELDGVLSAVGGRISVRQGVRGPAGSGQFVMVNTTASGSRLLNFANSPGFGNAVRGLGHGLVVLDFGLGVYRDISSGERTVGHAVAFNGGSTAFGAGAGFGVGLLLASNPVGWKIAAGIGVGLAAGAFYNWMYNNNILGFQTGIHWIGDQIDVGLAWIGNAWDATTNWASNAWEAATDSSSVVGQAIRHFGTPINPFNWSWGR